MTLVPACGGEPEGRLVLIGDSLAVGMEGDVEDELSGWDIDVDARSGRPLAEGMAVLAERDPPSHPTVFAFSLFTNDPPIDVPELERAVGDSLARAGRDGCVVWATIVRPPVLGGTYDAANRKLRQLAAEHPRRMRLVDWQAATQRQPSWLKEDGVHATPEGYEQRAALYADAVRRCGATR